MQATGKWLFTAAIAVAMTVGIVGAGMAQDATPAADAGAAALYPNHLHLGTCDTLDPAPAAALADLRFPDWVATLSGESAESDALPPDPASFGGAPVPVAVATTEVPMALADILSGGFGLNVHDAADPSIYIACGNVGGVPDDRGDLFIGLGEQNDSGYSGTAWLHDNGTSTTVVVFLNHPAAQEGISVGLEALRTAAAAATSEASPVVPAEATPMAPAEGTPVTT